jgi:hypothetical protein
MAITTNAPSWKIVIAGILFCIITTSIIKFFSLFLKK